MNKYTKFIAFILLISIFLCGCMNSVAQPQETAAPEKVQEPVALDTLMLQWKNSAKQAVDNEKLRHPEEKTYTIPAVEWNQERAEKEKAEYDAKNVIEYDQRSEEIASFMDDVNYKIYTGYTMVSTYKANRKEVTSTPRGYLLYTKPGQFITITNTSREEKIDPIMAEGEYTTIYNLIPGDIYQIDVTNIDEKEISTIKIRPTGSVRFINLEYVPNFRDMGGWETPNGTTAYGKLFRGGEIRQPTPIEKLENDLYLLKKLGITLEVDLRTDSEAGPIRTWQIRNNKLGCSQIEGAAYAQYDTNHYIQAIRLSNELYFKTVSALHDIITCINNGGIVYFHCSAGADRAGTLAFMLGGLLGIDEGDLDKDYELTSFAYQQNMRYRTYAGYVEMKDYINRFNGDTLQEKIYNWFLEAGFTSEELDKFIDTMTVPKER